jgi:sulfite exporter TauE/SafE
MCGGLVSTVASTRFELVRYHLGRLIGYATLGAVAGWAGAGALGGHWGKYVSWTAALLIAGTLFLYGARLWRGGRPHLLLVPAPWLTRAVRGAGGRPALLGLLTALLPCGWLQSFVVAAAVTRHPLHGAALMFAFWLGTVPGLSMAPWLISRWLRPLALSAPRLSAVILVTAGMATLGMQFAVAHGPQGPKSSCHSGHAGHLSAPPPQAGALSP